MYRSVEAKVNQHLTRIAATVTTEMPEVQRRQMEVGEVPRQPASSRYQ